MTIILKTWNRIDNVIDCILNKINEFMKIVFCTCTGSQCKMYFLLWLVIKKHLRNNASSQHPENWTDILSKTIEKLDVCNMFSHWRESRYVVVILSLLSLNLTMENKTSVMLLIKLYWRPRLDGWPHQEVGFLMLHIRNVGVTCHPIVCRIR